MFYFKGNIFCFFAVTENLLWLVFKSQYDFKLFFWNLSNVNSLSIAVLRTQYHMTDGYIDERLLHYYYWVPTKSPFSLAMTIIIIFQRLNKNKDQNHGDGFGPRTASKGYMSCWRKLECFSGKSKVDKVSPFGYNLPHGPCDNSQHSRNRLSFGVLERMSKTLETMNLKRANFWRNLQTAWETVAIYKSLHTTHSHVLALVMSHIWR